MSSTDKRTRRAASHSKSPYVPIADGVLGKLFLVVADTADLVTDLGVEGLLLEGLVRVGSRPPVGCLLYTSPSPRDS